MLLVAASAGLGANQQSDYGFGFGGDLQECDYLAHRAVCWYHDGKPRIARYLFKHIFTAHCLVRKLRQSYMLQVMYVIMSSKEAASLVC